MGEPTTVGERLEVLRKVIRDVEAACTRAKFAHLQMESQRIARPGLTPETLRQLGATVEEFSGALGAAQEGLGALREALREAPPDDGPPPP
jgi:hypothetical protein